MHVKVKYRCSDGKVYVMNNGNAFSSIKRAREAIAASSLLKGDDVKSIWLTHFDGWHEHVAEVVK